MTIQKLFLFLFINKHMGSIVSSKIRLNHSVCKIHIGDIYIMTIIQNVLI